MMTELRSQSMGEPAADLAIVGAIIVTVDGEDRILKPGSLAITGSRITAVRGGDEAVPKARRVISGAGKMVLPGFVNLHTHLVMTVLRGRTEDAGPASLYRHMLPLRRVLTPDHILTMSRVGALEALRFGSTTCVDIYMHAGSVGQAIEEAGLRGVLGESISDSDLAVVGEGVFAFDQATGQRRLKEAEEMLKFWHGRNDGLFRCLVTPHAPDTCSPDFLHQAQALSRQYQLPMSVHLAQSKLEGERMRTHYGKASVEFLADLDLLGPNMIGAHCIFITDREIRLLAESKTWVAHIPMVNAKRGYIAPIPALRALGANVAMGTDNMTEDMVMAMRQAMVVSRIKAEEPTALLPRDALRMATIEGARALGMEAELGSVEEGKLADLVIVDLNKPHLCPLLDPVPNYLHWGLASDVETVIVNGRVVLEDGHSVLMDEARILAEGQRTAELVRELSGN